MLTIISPVFLSLIASLKKKSIFPSAQIKLTALDWLYFSEKQNKLENCCCGDEKTS